VVHPRFSLRWWKYVLVCIGGMLMATSAYPVYHNQLSKLPLSVSFFWFSFFAALASFAVPGTLFSSEKKSLFERIALREWRHSISVGKRYVIGTGLTYSLYFLFLLKSLQYTQQGVIITILVLQQISPIIFTLAALYWLDQHCARWWAYGVGSIIVGLGVVIYKNALSDIVNGQLFDPLFDLVVLIVICDTAATILRAKHKDRHKIDALHTTRSVEIIAMLFGLAWIIITNTYVLPNAAELGALIFIGLIPTAFASIMINRSIDVIGVPMMASVRSLRPFFALAFTFIPGVWFQIEATHLGLSHYVGMALAVAGLLIIVWIAKPNEVKAKEIE